MFECFFVGFHRGTDLQKSQERYHMTIISGLSQLDVFCIGTQKVCCNYVHCINKYSIWILERNIRRVCKGLGFVGDLDILHPLSLCSTRELLPVIVMILNSLSPSDNCQSTIIFPHLILVVTVIVFVKERSSMQPGECSCGAFTMRMGSGAMVFCFLIDGDYPKPGTVPRRKNGCCREVSY